MSGITEIKTLLSEMTPELLDGEYVFVTLEVSQYGDGVELEPVAMCLEEEGMSLTVPRARAEAAGLAFDGVFRQISLGVNSSLEAIGLTAAIAAALTREHIAANVVAGRYHDHLFVPADRATDALAALESAS